MIEIKEESAREEVQNIENKTIENEEEKALNEEGNTI
jgi:hypothetical protein